MEENTLELGNNSLENNSVLLNVEQENEDEILRLQQEIIKSNVPIEDVAKIVGKLQKLLELTKHNTLNKNNNNFEDAYRRVFGDHLWKPYTPTISTPITLNGATVTSTPYPIDSSVTSTMTTTSLYSIDEENENLGQITTNSKPKVTLDDLKKSEIPF